ncbi:hypothetical protein H0H81_003022 [Sphagnurus paluster]|uniref:NADP-dependent oxidoreductase domain-containing protein n=1 Tax=Sphagnurus paluster TaxID=117069 RepID=A0A9P7K2I1_9AGAR|nr:hypothetical protein H0H81_003022 [Sphagnurus paluster]
MTPTPGGPKVEYRQLGKSGLRVSVPIVRSMISTWRSLADEVLYHLARSNGLWIRQVDWVLDEEKGTEILQAAWDMGINTIDTANMYSNGESERILSDAQNQIPRERIIVATKCYWLVAQDMSINTFFQPELLNERGYVNQSGLSRAAIFNAVDASLGRLQLTYIDLLQIHRFDPATPVEETVGALHDLVTSGKVRYIGASSMRTWQFALMNEVAEKRGWTKFVSMQSEYSLLYREEVRTWHEREMNAYCDYHEIGLIPWSPLGGGSLARPLNLSTTRSQNKAATVQAKYSTADEAIIKRVEELAEKRGVAMAQIALAWVGAKVASPIVGFNSVQRVAEGVTTGITLSGGSQVLGRALMMAHQRYWYGAMAKYPKAIRVGSNSTVSCHWAAKCPISSRFFPESYGALKDPGLRVFKSSSSNLPEVSISISISTSISISVQLSPQSPPPAHARLVLGGLFRSAGHWHWHWHTPYLAVASALGVDVRFASPE